MGVVMRSPVRHGEARPRTGAASGRSTKAGHEGGRREQERAALHGVLLPWPHRGRRGGQGAGTAARREPHGPGRPVSTPHLAGLDASPETRGAARAATVTREAAAIKEVARILADSGCVEPSDQYYVFLDSHDLDDDRAERAELLKLIGFLGLERVDAPTEATEGEVRVRTDTRLDVECARWS
ncbi:hypothetical protein ACH4MN_19825 [Streptomyces anulatus]|uniref:hypothetical protein n=1 Tax=unclassified Streptomyces TaxID=2593676 RepID=UPI001FFD3B5E|nr:MULTISPECIES: hypothetical protein [unclassified Streptomyces]